MLNQAVDLWKIEANVRCITTNGTVLPNGRNIMGGGCAGEAASQWPVLPLLHGDLITRHGQHVFLLGALVMFPTKRNIRDKASLDLIVQSARELVTLTDLYGWSRVAVPRPGAGLGGLQWEAVEEILEPILDDRFTIVSYPNEDVN